MQLVTSRRSGLVRYGLLTLVVMFLMVLVACVTPDTLKSAEGGSPEVVEIAQATITGTSTNPTISGEISLVETAAGLQMQGTLENVPAGMHGFHIHEGSSCAEEGKAAGGHFNPQEVAHGHLPSTGFDEAHAGDLGNLLATDNAPADWSLDVAGLTLTPGEFSVSDRTFILHADPDDLSQPTGNAGARIACGMIKPA